MRATYRMPFGEFDNRGVAMSIQNRAVSLAVLAAVAVPTEALAQSAPATQDTFIETVTVTAQKRAQDPIDVPISLTAYSSDFLKAVDIQEYDKLSLYVPGLEVQNQSPNNTGWVMRGITTDEGDAFAEPRVSIFQDGVSASKNRGSYVELFDEERIEIAKGPQSTLFGRAALIGAVNVIENKADPSARYFSFDAEAGNDQYGMIEGVANVPVTDDFAVRFAGRIKERDGYVPNLLGGADFNSTNTKAGRLSFDWRPTDSFKADLILNYEKDHPSGTSFKSGSITPTDPTTGAVIGDLSPYTGAALSTVPGFENNKPLGLDRSVWSTTLLAEDKLTSAMTLSSITGYRRFDSEEVFDPDGSSLPIGTFAEDARGDQFSQELRLNYDDGGMFSGFVGSNFFYENDSERVPELIDEQILLGLIAGQLNKAAPPPTAFFSSPTYIQGYAPLFLQGIAAHDGVALSSALASGIAANLQSGNLEQYENNGKTKSEDVYLDMTMRATDKLEFEGGVRYSHDDKTTGYSALTGSRSVLGGFIAALSEPAAVRNALLAGLASPLEPLIPYTQLPNFGLAQQPTAGNGNRITYNFHDNGLTWRLTSRYEVEENSDFYATYARGRRPQVVSADSTSVAPYATPTFTPVAAEVVNSYEVGYKTLTLGDRLRLDGALYYYTYTNFQTTIFQGTVQVTTNAGKANAYGFEGAANWALTDWADFFGTYAYSHARFAGASIYKGNQLRLSPDNKFSLGFSLRQPFADGTLTFLPTYVWQSKTFFNDNDSIPSEQGPALLPDLATNESQNAYGLFNMRLSYKPNAGHVTIGLFVDNVFDQRYLKDAGNTGSDFGIPTYIAGPPRFYGVSVSLSTQ